MAIIDATDHILGRLSSLVAKRLLSGEEISVVNAEKALVTGRRSMILEEFRAKRARAGHVQKRKGPFYPKRADRMLRRTVRGMLPYQHPKGREAFRRLRVYVGVPPDLQGQSLESLEGAKGTRATRYLSLGDVAEVLGGRVEV